jgi:predicted outer membrane repeat protein
MSPAFSVTTPRAARFMLVVSAALLALAVLAVHQTQAQTTIAVPDGDVQALITAIEDAHSSSGAVTIDLASSGDYQLTAEYTGDSSSGNGLPAITGEVTIQGNGATIRRDPDSENFRIFEIEPGGSLHLEGLTVSGGQTQLDGGGIFNSQGHLTLTDSEIINNTALYGAGIAAHNNATIEMIDTHISGNASGYGGGGIYVISNSTIEVTDSVIDSNTATFGPGGGIYVFQGEVDLIGSTLDGNAALDGGGISNSSGKVTLTDSTVRDNSANDNGGGIYNSIGQLTLTASTVHFNTSNGSGGGIYNEGSLELEDSAVRDNSSISGGGGIYNTGSIDLHHCEISGNEASSLGGGIRSEGSDSTVAGTACTISDNTSLSPGGGITIEGGSSVTLNASTINDNHSNAIGGGVHISGGSELGLTNSTVSGNEANVQGGGIYNSGMLNLINTTISGNQADSGGGGVYSTTDDMLTLIGSIVAANAGGDIAGTGSYDQVYSLISGDPLLGPLQDNGGPTETMMPMTGSPVLNQIPEGDHGCGVAGEMDTDQRGVPRPQGTHCDIGSVEQEFGFDHLEHIANPWFWSTWARTDLPLRDGLVSRTWMWGPGPFTTSVWEPYSPYLWNPDGLPIEMIDIPDTNREVIYFDKARMEINDPEGDTDSIWFVTNGLLVIEMITGNRQFGDDLFSNYGPSQANVAGDADDMNGPTYASFQSVLDAPAQSVGTLLTGEIDRDGNVTSSSSWSVYGVTVAHVDPLTEHGIAGPFWEFMNSHGLVHEGGATLEDALFANPFYATGRPVTQAYWAEVKVAGAQRDVLMQCFERRCLTYTPGNSPGFVVEAGNVGQHYYFWRYIQAPD